MRGGQALPSGSGAGLRAGEPYAGNGYDSDLPRIPHTLVDSIDAFKRSTLAKEAFGEDVHWHLTHMAEAEWTTFNSAVTDWELRRGFERL